MSTLTTTARGQITLRKEFLQHIGVEPGAGVDVQKLPNGELRLRASRKTGNIADAFHILPKPKRSLTLEEIDQAIQDGWAGVNR